MDLRKAQLIKKYDLKPFKIPDDMVVIVDTREQQPLFDHPVEGLTILNRKLDNGDYSIQGFEDRFCIERKKISDFYGYIGKERKKTVKKLERMLQYDFAGLVIEASEADILSGYVMSKVPPECARQSIVAFEIRYGLHVYYSRSRQDISRWCLDRMIKFWRVAHELETIQKGSCKSA